MRFIQKVPAFLMLTFTLPCFAQTNFDSTVYFYINTGFWGEFATIDTPRITLQSGDTMEFIAQGRKFTRYGKKVYSINNQDTALLIDFGLLPGDTLFVDMANGSGSMDSIVADSLVERRLNNGDTVKFLYLHSEFLNYDHSFYWADRLGSSIGWDYRGMYTIDYPISYLKAVCSWKEDLIYWDSTFSGFRPGASPDPSCDFEYLATLLGVQQHDDLHLNLRPNPVTTELIVEGMQDFRYSITNASGSKCLEGVASGTVNVTTLPKGFYFIIVFQGNRIYSGKFIK